MKDAVGTARGGYFLSLGSWSRDQVGMAFSEERGSVMDFSIDTWHKSVHELYQSFQGYRDYAKGCCKYGGRIIPICTPIKRPVEALLIGTNHSDFDRDPKKAEEIAIGYTNRAPTEDQDHTLMHHDHTYANRWKEIVKDTEFRITYNWAATNRCPIQTGPVGIRHIKECQWFIEAEGKMDTLLWYLIDATSPKYVFLCGEYALGLHEHFRDQYKKTKSIFSIKPQDRNGTTLVPLWHPSYPANKKRTIERLNEIRPQESIPQA